MLRLRPTHTYSRAYVITEYFIPELAKITGCDLGFHFDDNSPTGLIRSDEPLAQTEFNSPRASGRALVSSPDTFLRSDKEDILNERQTRVCNTHRSCSVAAMAVAKGAGKAGQFGQRIGVDDEAREKRREPN